MPMLVLLLFRIPFNAVLQINSINHKANESLVQISFVKSGDIQMQRHTARNALLQRTLKKFFQSTVILGPSRRTLKKKIKVR